MGSPLVLFVCVHNAGRSRMAEAYLRALAGGRALAASAGTEPAARPHPEVVAAMAEEGIAVPDEPGRLLTQELADAATLVIGMGCDVAAACPALRTPLEDWGIADPARQPPERVREIRDEVRARVEALIARLDSART